MTTNTLDLSPLTTLLARLGCNEPEVYVWETDDGQVTLAGDRERFTASLDWVIERLEGLDDGCGAEAVFEAFYDEDVEDEGQPDSRQERQDFAGDDDWRGYEIDDGEW